MHTVLHILFDPVDRVKRCAPLDLINPSSSHYVSALLTMTLYSGPHYEAGLA